MSRIVVAMAGALTLSTAAGAAIVPNIPFDTAAQYTGNFANVGTFTAGLTYNATGKNVLYNPLGDNSTGYLRYDTNAGDAGAHGPRDFLTETIKVDFTFSNLSANGSTGLYTRIQESTNKGILALLNVASATSARLRLFYGADIAATGVGTTFYDATFNLATGGVAPAATFDGGVGSANAIAANSPLTLTLTQTDAADPVFNLTVHDGDGPVASTGDQALASNAASNLYDVAGSIGIRTNLGNEKTGGVENTIAIDDFSATAVPEPATLAALALGGLLALRRGRRQA